MWAGYSKNRRSRRTDAQVADVLNGVSTEKLFAFVDMLAFPRHYVAERKANIRARDLLLRLLSNFGYTPVLQGSYDNIVVTSPGSGGQPYLLLGAHYDTVPETPGADDNASAVAVCLECARLLKEHGGTATRIVFFNREEDGLLGSREFVADLAPTETIAEAHIFEMVGFCTRAPGSQRMPPGIPGLLAPKIGDFLALLANRHSNAVAEELLRLAAT
jgi:acetylornithine deacetylase/succinyl-diaminopimelate desuccinylase-like protein